MFLTCAFYFMVKVQGDIMRDIIVCTNIHENSRVKIGVCFSNADGLGLVSVNMKVICKNGYIYNLLNNKKIFISDNSSLWTDSIQYKSNDTPVKAIVEIHSSGKLLYIQSFSFNFNNEDQDEILYILNTDVCWRRESPFVISVFNTNGNLLFLKGIYKDLWETLLTPVKPQDAINILLKKGYDQSKINASINSLIKRGLILEEQKSDIEYI